MSAVLRLAGELTASIMAYRYLVSPCIRWAARKLGAGDYPQNSLNGAYPEGSAARTETIRVVAIVLPATLVLCVIFKFDWETIALVPGAALGLVLWKCLTSDYDVARDISWQRIDRMVALALGVAAPIYQPLQLAAIIFLCGRLGAWTHHSKACLRIVKMSCAWMLVDGFAVIAFGSSRPISTTGQLVLFGTVFLSHYVVAFKTKTVLAGNPWKWIANNRTDLLVANAYAWGWGRFLPQERVSSLIRRLSPWVVPINTATLVTQALGLVAYTTPWCLITALMGAIVFNVMVALLSGLFFWENIGIALTIGLTVLCHPQDFSTAFGIAPCGLSIGILLLAISKWSWKPTGLGWWDTPYTSRVYWTAVTRSGLVVGLYNNHFSPHDREYGRDLGNYLTTEPVVTFSMGGVEDSSLKDLLLDMRIHGRDLLDIKDEYGQSKWRADFVRGHIQYMRNLIRGLNSGTRKNPLPEGLRWLRAPGGHLYYWGPLPRYERKKHGAINAVRVNQREIFFVTSECSWVVLRDELLFQIDTSE